ncbi:MAG: lipoyl synthase [bacterium]
MAKKKTIKSIVPNRPDWIKVKGIRSDVQAKMAANLSGLNTVCLSAKCPNLGECFTRGVATFMIGGKICTRACRFCGVRHGVPEPLDESEPERIASSIEKLGLKFIVITGVARDDLDDGGAGHYAETVRAIKKRLPKIGIEVLIPDFKVDASSIVTVLNSKPDILNHNLETVRRLTPSIRSKATYDGSLNVLRISRELNEKIPTKSGLMVGLGEEWDEIIETLEDLISIGCELVTIGQYLQPRADRQLPVVEYRTPSEFEELKKIAIKMGFRGVASGPFVRSSYMAEETAKSIITGNLAVSDSQY